jgi:hypothetical protein
MSAWKASARRCSRVGQGRRGVRLRDHGCGCGWFYEYEPGEPMGMPWPTPLIQLTAVSSEQVGNVADALRSR